MKHARNIILLACIALIASCTKELHIDEPTNRQMVLNADMTAGQTPYVNFAYTRFFLDNSNDHPIDGAVVNMTINGMPRALDSIHGCNYFFADTVGAGDHVAIDIAVAGRDNVHAETTVPPQVKISDLQTTFLGTEVFNFIATSFTLADHGGVDEIYSIMVQERDSGARYNEWLGAYDTIDTIRSTYFCLPLNPEITDNGVCPYIPTVAQPYMLYGSRIMFRDWNIDGREDYKISLLIPQARDTNEVEPFRHEYIITLRSVTLDYFRYIIAASRQSGATSFFSEQGQAYCNVDGALGLLTANTCATFRIDRDSVPPAHTEAPLELDARQILQTIDHTSHDRRGARKERP